MGMATREWLEQFMMRKTLLAVLISGAMVTGVQAAGNQVNGYLFGNIGQAEAEKPNLIKGMSAELDALADSQGWGYRSSWDDKDTAFKIGAGIQLNRHIAIEFQYTDLGSPEYKGTLTDGFDTVGVKVTGDTDGFGMNLVGTLPFDRFKLFGKIGYHKLETEASVKVSTDFGSLKMKETEKEWVTSYGIGASYAFTPQVELAAEFERYQDVADEYDVDMASIGLRYNF